MGWDFIKDASKQDIVSELLEPQSFDSFDHPGVRIEAEVVTHKLVGAVVWAVVKQTRTKEDNQSTTEYFIVCHLLANRRNYGWGSKSFTESQHPFYYSCPVEFLELAPEVNAEWRAEVRRLNWDGLYRDSVQAP